MKQALVCSVLLSCVAAIYAKSQATIWTCSYDGGKYTVQQGSVNTGVAWAVYEAPFSTSKGYGTLWLRTNDSYADPIQAYAAGYLEGWISVDAIANSYYNFLYDDFNGTVWPRMVNYMQDNIAWSQSFVGQIDYNNPQQDFDWQYRAQVGLVIQQEAGMLAGYNANRGSQPAMDALAMHLLNSDGDMDDLLPAFQPGRKPGLDLSKEHLKFVEYHQHCSSLVKLTADGQDLFAAHEMWGSFRQMIETYKIYDMPFHLSSTKSRSVSFSSYPAYLSSEDDFYITNAGLVVMETTNAIMNMSLYDLLSPQTLLSWVRAIVANRMATNGQDWTNIFQMHNSGTYNNQWIVVDYKKFTPGQALQPGALWILEQAPGYCESADVTSVLQKQGYWASYNIPYFPDMYVLTGNKAAYDQYGDVWSYQMTPRAQVFRRDQSTVKDLDSMQKIMRYNDFQHDPLSLGCPNFQLAARGDLAPPNPPPSWGGMCHRSAFGAINGKITSSAWVQQRPRTASIIVGPTSQTLPPFRWSNDTWKTPHKGQPDEFDFRWFQVKSPSAQEVCEGLFKFPAGSCRDDD